MLAEPIQPLGTVVAGQRVRWYPTAGQRALAQRCFAQERLVYNQALNQLEAAYRVGEKLSVNAISARWTAFKATHPEYVDVPSSVAGQTLRHLDAAFQHFFRRIKQGGKPGYPKAKGKFAPDQCSVTIDQRHAGKAEAWTRGELLLPGFGLCSVRGLRMEKPEFPGVEPKVLGSQPKTIALSRDAVGRYWLSFNHERLPKTLGAPKQGWHSEVGLDLGITTFATLSNGEKIDNPRHLQGRLKALRR